VVFCFFFAEGLSGVYSSSPSGWIPFRHYCLMG
jgi:hypothetical protein